MISKAGPVVGQLVGTVYPGAGKVISAASKAAKMAGYGRPARKCKSITAQQVEALRLGHGRMLKGGGISLALARKFAPLIKNISPAQVAALRNFFGRRMKGGGISLGGGGPSGFYSVTKTAPNITGRGTSLPGGVGGGLKLAGEGRKRRKKKILHY